ncbi:hypothetical protein [Paenibacillus validus]|uniref:hypothetical protein n=1 Tax=Paenibacillus validus TaxID=44253 RepID=UPI003D271556
MSSIEYLIRKVSRYVTFGQPVSSGSVISQRLSDPRIPMLAYYLGLQEQDKENQYYHEVWLKKEGTFALTEAWYKGSMVTRKLYKDNLSFEQLTGIIGEEDANAIIMRFNEIMKKSEKDDWRPYSLRT